MSTDDDRRDRRPRTVFTNGVFDLFHDGHARLLARTRAEGERLIVGVCSDASTAALKRPPVQPWEVRAARVAAEPGVERVLETPWTADLTPAFYAEHSIELQVQGDRTSDFGVAERLGILKVIGRTEGISTSKLIAILAAADEQAAADARGPAAERERDGSSAESAADHLAVRSVRVRVDDEVFVVRLARHASTSGPAGTDPCHAVRVERDALTTVRARLEAAAGTRDGTPATGTREGGAAADGTESALIGDGSGDAIAALGAILPELLWADEHRLILRAAPADARSLGDELRAGRWDDERLGDLVDAVRALHGLTADGEVAATQPGRHRSLLHGQLTPDRVLVWSDGMLLTDLASATRGDPTAEIASFLAQLLDLGRAQDRSDEVSALVRRLVDRYRGGVSEDAGLLARIGLDVGVGVGTGVGADGDRDVGLERLLPRVRSNA